MSATDLHVLAAAFEQAQGTFQTRSSAIAALGGQLQPLRSVLGDQSVGGDQCAQLAQQVDRFARGLQTLGGIQGVGGVVTGIQRILEKFQEVDRAQAANAHLVSRPGP